MSKTLMIQFFILVSLASGCAQFSHVPVVKSNSETEIRAIASINSTKVSSLKGGMLQVTKDFTFKGNDYFLKFSKGNIVSNLAYGRDIYDLVCTLTLKEKFDRDVTVKVADIKYKISDVIYKRSHSLGMSEPEIIFNGTKYLESISCSNSGSRAFSLDEVQETLGDYFLLEMPSLEYDGTL